MSNTWSKDLTVVYNKCIVELTKYWLIQWYFWFVKLVNIWVEKILIVRYEFLGVKNYDFTAHCPALTVHYPVLTVHYPVLTVQYPVLTVHYPVLTLICPVITVHYPVITLHCPVLNVHYPILNVNYPVFTLHRTVITAQCWSQITLKISKWFFYRCGHH